MRDKRGLLTGGSVEFKASIYKMSIPFMNRQIKLSNSPEKWDVGEGKMEKAAIALCPRLFKSDPSGARGDARLEARGSEIVWQAHGLNLQIQRIGPRKP